MLSLVNGGLAPICFKFVNKVFEEAEFHVTFRTWRLKSRVLAPAHAATELTVICEFNRYV